MEMSFSQVSTRQAAEILGVHESSVKRWCNKKNLSCRYTSGGHRRFDIVELLAFARNERLASPLLSLHPYELEIWEALSEARDRDNYEPLVALVYARLMRRQPRVLGLLLGTLVDLGLPFLSICDRVLAPVLHHVGSEWEQGRIGVGEEHRMTHHAKDALAMFRHRLLDTSLDTSGAEATNLALVGCVRGEEHELGALITRLYLETQHWEVIYLGANVPNEEFAYQQQKHHAALVCVSLSSLQNQANAQVLVRMLARLYDPAHPYRLAIGGNIPPMQLDAADFPFTDVQVFHGLTDFARWL